MQPADRISTAATEEDITELNQAMRGLMHQVKTRHRQQLATSDHGPLAVLFVLAQSGPMRASSVAKEISLDLSTVSRHLRALEDGGQVERTADPDDKRAYMLGITDKGAAYVQEYWEKRTAQVHAALAHWTSHDVRTLADLMTRFVRDTEGLIK